MLVVDFTVMRLWGGVARSRCVQDGRCHRGVEESVLACLFVLVGSYDLLLVVCVCGLISRLRWPFESDDLSQVVDFPILRQDRVAGWL